MASEDESQMARRIAHNVARIRAEIAQAAQASGRSADDVALVAVTKTRSVEEIRAAYAAGVRHFGENRVEEAEQKLPLQGLVGVTWHMVGHLQRRKARRAVELFDRVDSVDSVRLARRLDSMCAERAKVLPVLVEVNVSGEESKYGLPLSDRELLEAAVSEIVSLPHLRVEGLMTVAFVAADPEAVRPVFAGLRELRSQLETRLSGCNLGHLSMGMSADFGVGVQEGATMVRIGRALFE